MTFAAPPHVLGKLLPRSASNGGVSGFRRRPPAASCAGIPSGLHLITTELWEAITGERVTPATICQLLDSSIPQCDSSATQPLPAMQLLLMCRDRQGSHTIQHRIEGGTDAERQSIFSCLAPHLSDLVCDPAGNFVIQKLCEFAKDDQRRTMLSFFLSQRDRVTEHPNGCRVLQKFIEFSDVDTIDKLFVAMREILVRLCFNQNGNHIVQRFVETLPGRVAEVVAIIQPRVVDLVVDNCGCRVVQRLFDLFKISALEPLIPDFLLHAVELATNQYGNYVVQNIIESGRSDHVSALVAAFRGHFYEFSMHKFASNVIEKCIRGATASEQLAIFGEIIGRKGAFETERIRTMVVDQFGNYVVQRIIEYGSDDQQNAIYRVVCDNYERLVQNSHARFVINMLQHMDFDF